MSNRYELSIKTILVLLKIYLKGISRLLFAHQRNIKSLAVELFKVEGNHSNNMVYDIFQTRKINYNLTSLADFVGNRVNTNKISKILCF